MMLLIMRNTLVAVLMVIASVIEMLMVMVLAMVMVMVMAMVMVDTRSAPIDGYRKNQEIQDADVAVHVERLLDLRQVVGTDQRLLVGEQRADQRHAGEIEPRQRCDPRQCDEAHQGDDMHAA